MRESAFLTFDKSVVSNNIASFYSLLGTWPGGALYSDAHFLWAYTGIPAPTFNGVVRAGGYSIDELQAFLHRLRTLAREKSVPVMWWDEPPVHREESLWLLEASGFQRADTVPGMALDLEHLPAPSLPEAVRVEAVATERQLAEWVTTWVESWKHPNAVGEAYHRVVRALGGGDQRQLTHYIAYLHDTAVAVATSFVADRVVGIYQVGTVDSARRLGIGGCLTAYALAGARDQQDAHTGILYASPLGYHVYQQLGFQEVCAIPRFVLRAGV